MDMADGKVNGQKAFMSGKLKVKGNIMLATSEFLISKQFFSHARLLGPSTDLTFSSLLFFLLIFIELDGVLKAQKSKL